MKVLTFSLGEMRTNTYFCFDESGGCIVIDPGMDGEGIYEKLVTKNLKPTHIILTHGHFDHSQGVKALAERTGALICVHERDAVMLEDPRFSCANLYYRGNIASYPRTKADVLLRDGDEIRSGSMVFRVMHTPGHTPGSVCLDSGEILFCGDTVFAYGYGRYDLWGGNREELSDSLAGIAELEENRKLCPGHGNSATLDRVRDEIRAFSRKLKS